MINNLRKTFRHLSARFLRGAIICTAILPAAAIIGSPAAIAQTSKVIGCMEDLAGFSLNCKANDVRIASATNIVELDDGCAYPGDTVDFTATFEVLLGAQARHDIGLYFATDGDPNKDGAISGSCNVTTMPFTGTNPDAPPPHTGMPWLDLDGTSDPFPGDNTPSAIQDTCGDIDGDHNPLFPTIKLLGVACIDPDEDGKLNLPNCTSWRQPGANDLCQGPEDAFPGSPSKCRCDIGFNVDIVVPAASFTVTKTANPTSVNEPSGSVTFTVTVTNTGIDPNNPATLNSLTDDIYKNITTSGHDGITATTCSVPQTLPADDGGIGGIDTYYCTFTTNVTGNAGDTETDTVTASGVDSRGNPLSGIAKATVTIDDVQPGITVTKTANPTEVLEPGGAVTFSVSVTNNSVSSDPVTIDSLIDNVHGNLAGQGDCSVPKTIGSGVTYSCSFTADVTGNAGFVETDTITARGTDDEGNPVSDSDSATVTIIDVPSMIEVIKTANLESVKEPGGDVTYTYTVNNKSAVDTVTINSLVDNILGNLNGQGTCSVSQELAPSDGAPGGPDSYTCMVTAAVSGNAGDSITNTAKASGVDDDGTPVEASNSETVNITNVPPAASLSKTVKMAVVTYEVTVTNDSEAEALTLTQLIDAPYGNITLVHGDITATTCSVPQILQPSGELGDSYTCSFDAKASASPTTDKVTGDVSDDDGSPPATPSDSATIEWK